VEDLLEIWILFLEFEGEVMSQAEETLAAYRSAPFECTLPSTATKIFSSIAGSFHTKSIDPLNAVLGPID
jgi:hypothetical protein